MQKTTRIRQLHTRDAGWSKKVALLRAKDAFFAATNALPRETLALSCPMKTSIALLTIPESSGSLLYGMADLFVSVRRDWSQLVKGSPEPSPFEVHLTGRAVGPLRVANGMLVEVARTYDYFPDILCVPEVLVGLDEELGDRFTPENTCAPLAHAALSSPRLVRGRFCSLRRACSQGTQRPPIGSGATGSAGIRE